MTTITMNYPNKINIKPLFILFLTLILSIVFCVEKQHAVEKHGEDAILVRTCLNDKGASYRFYNPDTNRIALICIIDGNENRGTFGIQIVDNLDEEVTSFIKNKLNRIDQVFQYLKNCNYVR